MALRFALTAAAVVALAGCGGRDRTGLVLYLKQDGSRARPEQIVPVLQRVERRTPSQGSIEGNVVRALLRGPTAAERERGFRPLVHTRVRRFSVHIRDGTAVLDYSGAAIRDFYAEAALVFSLTELPGVERVSLRFDGRPCCVYDLESRIIDPLTRKLYRGWPGEPCEARTYPDAVRCRG
jgi:spore germination protein GerM